MGRTASPVVRRRWQQLLDGFDSGVETVAQFCDRNGVSTTSFYKWKRKFSASELDGELATRQPTPAFLPVQIDQQVPLGESAVSVRLGEIRVDVPVAEKELLFELVDRLRAALPIGSDGVMS